MNILFSTRLRMLRKTTKLKQKDIAMILGITETGYGHYERGSRMPDLINLVILSNIFKCSTDYLLGKTDYKDPYP